MNPYPDINDPERVRGPRGTSTGWRNATDLGPLLIEDRRRRDESARAAAMDDNASALLPLTLALARLAARQDLWAQVGRG